MFRPFASAAAAAMFLLSCDELRAQLGTSGVPTLNYYSVATPAGPLPPFGSSCPGPVVPLSVGLSPLLLGVASPTVPTAAGAPVFGLINLGPPCFPGFLCLPPAIGPYAGIPPVVACGGVTNQSYDLPPGAFTLFFGNLSATGTFVQPLTLFPAWVGVTGSTQAFFLDPVFGFVMTDAWDFIIVP